MATTRNVNCRTHPGGKFIAPARRGRPRVRCDEGFRCTAYETAIKKPPTKRELAAQRAALEAADKAAHAPKNQPKTVAAKELVNAGTDEGPQAVQERVRGSLAGRDASLAKAKRAKEMLTAQGWAVEGKAKGSQAEITAVREEEMLLMVWDNGALITSHYSLWSSDRPRENGMPPSELPEDFNTDEMSDREIVAALSGCKVTWWNRLGQLKESAVVSTKRITIEHVYDEQTISRGAQPSERTIKFVDHNGDGYKAFRLGALLKVG